MSAVAAHVAARGGGDVDAVERMLGASPHRGHDRASGALGAAAVGVVRNHLGDASLAHEHGLLVGFAGVLDNGAELARELGSSSPASPAATVAQAFERWGEAAFNRLRGTHAGVVTDGERLWAFRDHFGARPLFQRRDGAGWFVATEAKQVLAGACARREPDLDALEQRFFGHPTTATALRGVHRVPRASFAVVSPGTSEWQPRIYWDPDALVETLRIGPTDAAARFRELFEQAVSRAITGRDVILLSGGVDSPSVAAMAATVARRSGIPVAKALAAVYPEHPSVDESEIIEAVAAELDLELHTFVSTATAIDDPAFWSSLLDGPVEITSIPEVAEAYQLARGLGGDTVLTGELQEHVFEVRAFVVDHLLATRRVRAAARYLRSERAIGRRRRRLAREVARAFAPPSLMVGVARRRAGDYRTAAPWLDRARLLNTPYRPELGKPARRRWRDLQSGPLYPYAAGFDNDEIVAAYCGVRVRYPFGDIDLWEFALGLPADVKFPSVESKSFIRPALRGLVPAVALERRHKTVFNEHSIAAANYAELRRWLIDPPYRVPGVDYDLLASRLDTADMGVGELWWAQDLTRLTAFVATTTGGQ